MFTGNPNSVRNNLSRGFQELNELYRVHRDPVTRAEDFKEPVLDWVEGKANEPFFLYVHYVQPHQPYDVAPKRFYLGLDPHYDGEFRGSRQVMRQLYHGRLKVDADDVEHIRGLYHGNLRYADWAVGELVAALRESGILERSILVLTADHGEGLGERGVFGHGRSVDREVSPAPLIIRFPSRLGLVGRRAFPVGNADIMATLLDVVGGPVPQGIWGRSFLPMLEDSAAGLWPRPLPSWAGGGPSRNRRCLRGRGVQVQLRQHRWSGEALHLRGGGRR